MRNGNTRNRAAVRAERINIAAVNHFNRHVAESQAELNGRSSRRGSQNMTGGRFCATLLRPRIHQIIGGRPNRRFVSSGLYLPSVERRSIGEIVIAVDTSGSIGTQELEQFSGEINAIANEAQPELIRVIYCDAAVQAVDEFGLSEPITLSPKGGGGTDFIPAFKWVEEEENDIEPMCLIYLTDLCRNSFPPAPDYPVLWVTDSQKTAPFGETLRIRIVD